MKFTTNEIHFCAYLLSICIGTTQKYPDIDEYTIQIPKDYLLDTMDIFVEKLFADIANGYLDEIGVTLSNSHSKNVNKLNEIVMEKFPYLSQM